MNITTSFNQKSFIIPASNFTTSSHYDLISLIMKRHGENEIFDLKMIDDNDDYDSFFVKTANGDFCLKLSFDDLAIFYEYMILKGIQNLNIAPYAVDRNRIEYGKRIYYTIQTFEHSNNLLETGFSSLVDNRFDDFNKKLALLHSYEVPEGVVDYLDNTKSFLEYQNNNFFKNVLPYVDQFEEEAYKVSKKIFEDAFEEMMNYFFKNEKNLKLNKLVHGNLCGTTIIENSFIFKFINFENCFYGSPFFDIANLVFELQMTGLKEFDFVSKRVEYLNPTAHRFASGELLNEYKICKNIWIRKKMLDLVKEYVKEAIVYNKMRKDKILRINNDFVKNFYRFQEVQTFQKNCELFLSLFTQDILNNQRINL
jgi:hypothetical protein